MNSLLSIEGWDKQGKVMEITYYSPSKKWLDAKATEFHNEIVEINKAMLKGSYKLSTYLHKIKNKEYYALRVKAKYYKS